MKLSTPLALLCSRHSCCFAFIRPPRARVRSRPILPWPPTTAQSSRTPSSFLDRLDPSIDRIIPTDAKIERVAKGFTWVEGPVWVKDRLFFAEIPSNSIRTWTPGKGTSIFLQPSGYMGSAPYGGPESGLEMGLTLDVVDGSPSQGTRSAMSIDSNRSTPKGPSPSLPTSTRASNSIAQTMLSTNQTARSTSPIHPTASARKAITIPTSSSASTESFAFPTRSRTSRAPHPIATPCNLS